MRTSIFGSTTRSHWRVFFAALLLAGYALGLPLDAAALAVTRGPYLQLGTQSGIAVRWRTDTATDSRVRYGTSPTDLRNVVSDAASTTEHVVKLTGLNPATQYYYSVGNSTATLAGGDGNHFFVTAPTPGTEQPTHIWVVGASGAGRAKARAVRDAYIKYKGGQYTHLWLMSGDNAYIDGTDSEYQAALFDMYPTLLRQTVLWPTLGDHDGHMADSASQSGPYYDIFTLPKQGEAGGVASGTKAYYSFDYANIHFVVLDSVEISRPPTGAMLTWLKNDLAATTQPWIIAYWHHPPYSKGSHDSDTETALREMRANALPILEDAGVDLVLRGHSGSYERSFLIDRHYDSSGTFDPATMLIDGGDGRIDGDGGYQKSVIEPAPGTVYAMVGSPGENRLRSLDHPVMYVSLKVFGSMVLDVDGPVLDATFLDDTGQVRDHFRVVKTTRTAEAKRSDDTGQVRDHFQMVKTTRTAEAKRSGTDITATGSSPTSLSIVSATTQGVSSTSNLVAQWTLDTQDVDASQSSAEVRDVSGRNNHADLKNHSGTTVPGKLGQALSFDGIDDYAERISFSGLPTSAITVSAWIKLDTHKNWNRVVNHEWVNNGWLLFTDASGAAIFGVGQSGAQYNATKAGLTVGNWYHLVGVYDGSNVRIYVNGQEGTPRAKSGVALDNVGNVDIGGADGDRFKGSLDDVRIYNRALTASEVQALYNGGGTTDTSPPSIPSGLSATAVSSSQINLAWSASTDNVGVTGYKIFRGGTQIATTTGTSYSNTGLSPFTTYSYTVAAHDAAGNTSAQSTSVSATTQAAPDTTAPSTPTGLTATAISSSQVNLSWNESTDNVGVVGYRVERCQGSGCTSFVQIATPTGTSYQNTGLSANTPYQYRVRAIDAAGNLSGYSSIASVTTQSGQGFVVGIGPQSHDSWGATQRQRLIESGTHSIRVGADHGGVALVDETIETAKQNNMSVLYFAGYDRGISGITTSAAARQQYADKALADVKKYGNVIKYIEVWNEWNGGIGLGCSWGNPPCTDGALYTDLLCKVYNTVKSVRPDITIIGGATAGVDMNFITKMLDAGAGKCMDMLSVHPYVFTPTAYAVDYHASPNVAVDKVFQAVNDIENLVMQKTGRTIPLALTEDGRTDGGNTSEEQRTADYLTALFTRSKTHPHIHGIWWYALVSTAASGGAGYGLLNTSLQPKPGYYAFKNVATTFVKNGSSTVVIH